MRVLFGLISCQVACGDFREATLSTSITAPLGNGSAYTINTESSCGCGPPTASTFARHWAQSG